MKYKHKVGEEVKIETMEKDKKVIIAGRGMEKCRLIYFYDDEDGDTKWFYEHQVKENQTP